MVIAPPGSSSAPAPAFTNCSKAEITLTSHSCDCDLPPDGTSRRLHIFELGLTGSVQQNGDDGSLGNQFVQQLQPLGDQIGAADKADAGDIAARAVEARDEADPHRIGADCEDDRRIACDLGCVRRGYAARDNHGYPAANHLGHQSRQPIIVIFGPAVVDGNALALDEAHFSQALPERCHKMRRARRCRAPEEANHRHHRLLRACHERPRRRRAAKERDELAPRQSIKLHSLPLARVTA